jgi:hypothetical protein
MEEIVMRLTVLVVCIGSAALLASGAFAQQSMGLSESDKELIQTCIGLEGDSWNADAECSAAVKRANISAADIKSLQACLDMQPDAMMKDDNCSNIMRKHPGLLQTSNAASPEKGSGG